MSALDAPPGDLSGSNMTIKNNAVVRGKIVSPVVATETLIASKAALFDQGIAVSGNVVADGIVPVGDQGTVLNVNGVQVDVNTLGTATEPVDAIYYTSLSGPLGVGVPLGTIQTITVDTATATLVEATIADNADFVILQVTAAASGGATITLPDIALGGHEIVFHAPAVNTSTFPTAGDLTFVAQGTATTSPADGIVSAMTAGTTVRWLYDADSDIWYKL